MKLFSTLTKKKIYLFFLGIFFFFPLAFPSRINAQESGCSALFYKDSNFTPENKIDKLVVKRTWFLGGATTEVLNTNKLYILYPSRSDVAKSSIQVGFWKLGGVTDWIDIDSPKKTVVGGREYIYVGVDNFDSTIPFENFTFFNSDSQRFTWFDRFNTNPLMPASAPQGLKEIHFQSEWDGVRCSTPTVLPISDSDEDKKNFQQNCTLQVSACRKEGSTYEIRHTVNFRYFEIMSPYMVGLDEGFWVSLLKGLRPDIVPLQPEMTEGSVGLGPVTLSLSEGVHNFCVLKWTRYITDVVDACSSQICQGSVNIGADTIKKCDGTEDFLNPDDADKTPGAAFNLCGQIPLEAKSGDGKNLRDSCCECAGGIFDARENSCVINSDPKAKSGLWTAIGCVRTDQEGIIKHILRVGLMISGGFALLVILISSFMLSTSQGDPKRTGEAKEQLTAAIMGLVFIIFSITILRFIGVDILRLPGFGG